VPPPSNAQKATDHKLVPWICLGLFVATITTFWPSVGCDYLGWDDNEFIAQNVHVQQGLTWSSLKWAFSAIIASNWHPVTTLSFLFGWQLWGFNPAADHLFNVGLHALNAIVLFLLVRKLTGTLWRSALVAALFAVHPLRVESVTWIAERKDLLSALFFFIAIWIYADWVKDRRSTRYMLMLVAFALALMSKPMVVTLPFALLLLDYWPLKRPQTSIWKLAAEKIPLFAMSATLCAATYFVQRNTGAMAALAKWTLGTRLSNAVMAYGRYIEKFFWPTNLTPLYLPPAHWPFLSVIMTASLLVWFSVIILVRARKTPLCTGWFWYLGTLVPVIGLIQVGSQAMADRYSYLPFVGVYIAVAWVVFQFARTPAVRTGMAVGCCVVLTGLAFKAHQQIRYWQNSETVFNRMIAMYPNNPVAYNGLGTYYVDQRRYSDAIKQFEIALELLPNFVDANNNLGVELARKGNDDEAIRHFRAAVEANPNFEMAHKNLAKALERKGNLDEAILHYRRAYEIAPDRFVNANELGVCYFKKGAVTDAAQMFSKATDLAPNNATGHANFGKALFAMEAVNEAAVEYAKAVALAPTDPDAQFHYGLLLAMQNNPLEAERHLREALRLKPNFADAESALSKVLEQQPRGR
jgi:tetratricopeptide (TPR) repeat protein